MSAGGLLTRSTRAVGSTECHGPGVASAMTTTVATMSTATKTTHGYGR